jgi:hypothetical protein
MRLVSQKRLDQVGRRIPVGRAANEVLDRATAEVEQWCSENPDATRDYLIQNIADHLARHRMLTIHFLVC